MLALAPTSVFALALAVGLLKGRYAQAAVALAAWIVLAVVAEAAIGTLDAGDAPLADAWIVVLLQLAGWVPALVAAAGAARAGSWWARSGRRVAPAGLAETAANFVWVFVITLLGILFAGVDILGAEIFCALFGALLAGVMLFGFGSARSQPA
ncbi:MAG TPA: hypothetical protein VFY99_02125 [Solirubrobacterales bacterium]